ncbi:MAG: DNA polymerase III subunit gamma/tau [Marinirhabdus sp.]
MEHFIVSARKYRPTQFKDVVGQQVITNTLLHAIENNHLAQALLFTGPRGVGKTTCARILAKQINQEGNNRTDEDFAFNIFELDAASNNSVDDIRALIDQVRIPPQAGKYKVYIIDEVHMLSSAAFNAFLKTLEEPPKHAIFILATTEKHKIIPTILSRCQSFDFRRITVQDIKEHLAQVAQAEGIHAEDGALHIIAQKADGALRDALSIFDRVVSFSGKQLTRGAVTQNLNVLDYTYYFDVTDLLLENNLPKLLLAYDRILAKGFDGQHFIMGLATHFRDLLVCKNQETISLLEVGEGVKTRYFEQSQKAPQQFLMGAIALANTCDLKYKTSRNQRLLVELCLLQLGSLTANENIQANNNIAKKPFVLPPSRFKNVEPVEEKKTTPPIPYTYPEELTTRPMLKVSEEAAVYKTKNRTGPPKTVSTKKKTVAPSSEQAGNITKKRSEILLAHNKKKTSALSLKSIQQKKQMAASAVAKQPNSDVLPTEDFTEEAMIEAWNQFARKVEQQGKFNLLSHLTMGTPKLAGNRIHLVFPNHTIRIEVERAKNDLLHHIRKTLNNHSVDLCIKVDETETKRYAYTPREKFEKLKEINPLMDTLRKEFDLDV